jgi:hypothetical protein
MTRVSRYLYIGTAWAAVIGLVLQVLWIGLGLQLLGNDPSSTEMHRGLGWLVHLMPILVIPFAFLARAGSRHWQWSVASAVVVFLIPIFIVAGSGSPILMAMHPVSALIGFVLAVVVAVNSLRALNAPVPQANAAAG